MKAGRSEPRCRKSLTPERWARSWELMMLWSKRHLDRFPHEHLDEYEGRESVECKLR
jgi:hypothetical protein